MPKSAPHIFFFQFVSVGGTPATHIVGPEFDLFITAPATIRRMFQDPAAYDPDAVAVGYVC